MDKSRSILNLTLGRLIMFNERRFRQNVEIRRDGGNLMA